MTPKKIAEWIVEGFGCYGSDFHDGVSCNGKSYGINAGTPCPLYGGEFNCDNYESPLQAAQAWMEANGEDKNV